MVNLSLTQFINKNELFNTSFSYHFITFIITCIANTSYFSDEKNINTVNNVILLQANIILIHVMLMISVLLNIISIKQMNNQLMLLIIFGIEKIYFEYNICNIYVIQKSFGYIVLLTLLSIKLMTLIFIITFIIIVCTEKLLIIFEHYIINFLIEMCDNV